jgi:glycerol-3-phosphate acyltransferase PlsY
MITAHMARSLRFLGAAAAGYLLGSIPSADIATKLATGGTVDLREVGSGNPGGTNAAAVLGKQWGYGVIVADVVKAAVAAGAGRALAGDSGAHIAGSAAVAGHCFPIWSGFRGGKGVACAGGQFLMTFPVFAAPDIAASSLAIVGPPQGRGLRFVAIASCGRVTVAYVWWRKGWPNWWGPKPTAALPASAVATASIVLYKFVNAKRPLR